MNTVIVSSVAVGLAIYVWPIVIYHTNELATSQRVRFALLAHPAQSLALCMGALRRNAG